ncbi:MAG: hypothetical protein K6C38_01855 [Saccharofermentans sp.]|nr:hypothetical protein [Saccharofermentans sp.]
MNNSKLTKDIAQAFEAPAPVRREKFLYENGLYTKKSHLSLIISQTGYIHKSVWILSIMVLIAAVVILQKDVQAAVRFSSLIMPFVAGTGVFATMRSRMYGMNELEAATVMSLRGSIFTKFAIISVSHLILMIILAIFMGTGCHIVAPYLLTSALCMELERTKVGRDSQYFCFLVSGIIAVLVYLTQSYLWPLIAGAAGAVSITATALLILANVREYIIIYKMEESKWNFV